LAFSIPGGNRLPGVARSVEQLLDVVTRDEAVTVGDDHGLDRELGRLVHLLTQDP